jgi:DNA-binding NarL/FixJ family response regulator
MAQLLTSREWQIATMVVQGLPDREIAQRLEIGVGTVKLCLHHIYGKLDVPNRTALAVTILSGSAFRQSGREVAFA